MTDKLSEPLDDLKERELEIINLMANGLSNQEIADKLFITKGTVRWYNKQIYSKLGTSRRTEAIAIAREMGLIQDDNLVAPVSQQVLHTPPIPTGPFIGRTKELHDLVALLDKPDVRLISIIALGGMGKSRLSLEVANHVKHNYEHGAAFIDLTSIRNPQDIVTVTNTSLGLSVESKLSPEKVLFDYCREKELLLIFDNFEHLLEGSSFLTDILENAPAAKIIATSRESLNLRVETAFYLPPVMNQSEQLFAEVATMMYPRFTISESEVSAVNRLVDLVGGSPLALTLAASWVDTLSVDEIVEEIQSSLDFLSSDMHDIPQRQQSIRAVIDPSWKRLSPEEQKVFMYASVFRGGFTRNLLRKVTGASVKVLQTLLNRSLIHHGYGRRYEMHPLVRQYAREKLETSGMLLQARLSHLKTYLSYAQEQIDRMYDGQHYLESLEALHIEHDNFRVALDWSFSGHETEIGVELTQTLHPYWMNKSLIREAIGYLKLGLKFHHDDRLYMHLGFCQYRMGHMDEALASIHNAIKLAEESQSLAVLANSYRMLGFLSVQEKPVDETQHLLEKALNYAEQSGVPQIIASCHDSLGEFLTRLGASSSIVLDHLEKELTIRESIGDVQGISSTIYNMAVEYYALGETKQARKLCERSLALKRQIGDRAGIARRLATLARWDLIDEEFEKADHAFAESIALAEELGERHRLQSALVNQGIMYLIRGEYIKSQFCLENSLNIAKAIKSAQGIEHCHSFLSNIFLIQGNAEEAKLHIREAIEACINSALDSVISLTTYANYLWYQGHYEACVPLVAFLNLEMERSERSQVINNKYFLLPLIYRVKQHIGQELWDQSLKIASEITFEQIFDEIIRQISLWDQR